MSLLNPAESPENRTAEIGGEVDGERVSLDRRTYIQFTAYTGSDDTPGLIRDLDAASIPGVLYEDVNDPTGIGLAVAYQDADRYVTELRVFLQESKFATLEKRHEMTMFGRSYAIGYEKDLTETLLRKPINRLTNSDLTWAVWYPLRRKGLYETLSPKEQHDVQIEHMQAGRSFASDTGIKDIRLASFGMTTADDDFVVALLGPDLHPLSQAVQLMRKSKQTSLYLLSLGPFFIGRVAGRSITESMFKF